MNRDQALDVIARLRNNVKKVVYGRDELIDIVLTAMFSNGHVLTDDHRGSGVGLIASTLGYSIRDDLLEEGINIKNFARVNCAPELRIEDLIGEVTSTAAEIPGTIFHYILFLDNFSNADQLLKSRVIQAISDNAVFFNGRNCPLGELFLVIASYHQSDGEIKPLRFSEIDHFQFRYQVKWLDAATQREILMDGKGAEKDIVTVREIIDARKYIQGGAIKFGDDLIDGLSLLSQGIAESDKTQTNGGPSIRVLKDLRTALKAWVFVRKGADSVTWDDVQEIGGYMIPHHIRKKQNILDSPQSICNEVFNRLTKIKKGNATAFADLISRSDSSRSELPSKESRRAEADLDNAWRIYKDLRDRLMSRIYGRNTDAKHRDLGTIELILTALFSEGHILFEDYPGSGKSYMSKTLGNAIADDIHEEVIDIESYRRIQCTPDLLPSDITGYMIFRNNLIEFQRGPIFAYVVLIDEINRTTPKVQSAVLEAMAEKQVTVEDRTYSLGEMFLVLATQNPLDRVGTYELPAAQLDRFLFKRRLEPMEPKYEGMVIAMDDEKLLEEWCSNNEIARPKPEQQNLDVYKQVKVSQIVGSIYAIKNKVGVHPDVVPCLLDITEKFAMRCRKDYENSDEALKPGSRPSPRTMQRLLQAMKVRAFVEYFSNERSGPMVVMPHMLSPIACDVFRHRIVPVKDLDEDSLDELIRAVVKQAINEREERGE